MPCASRTEVNALHLASGLQCPHVGVGGEGRHHRWGEGMKALGHHEHNVFFLGNANTLGWDTNCLAPP